jgi:hypothetical protein
VYELAKQAPLIDVSQELDAMIVQVQSLQEVIDTQETTQRNALLADTFLKLALVAQILNVDLEKEVARVWEGRK